MADDEEREFEWVAVSDWPAELTAKITDLEALERVYELLKTDGPGDVVVWDKGMEYLRRARQERRAEIAQGILAAHGITLEEEPALA